MSTSTAATEANRSSNSRRMLPSVPPSEGDGLPRGSAADEQLSSSQSTMNEASTRYGDLSLPVSREPYLQPSLSLPKVKSEPPGCRHQERLHVRLLHRRGDGWRVLLRHCSCQSQTLLTEVRVVSHIHMQTFE